MKFVLLVEGRTEQAGLPDFLRRWLNKKYSNGEIKQRVGMEAVKFEGNGDLIRKAAAKANDRLNNAGSEKVIAVISLLDLYGLPRDFFSNNNAMQNAPVEQRYNWAKQEWKSV